MNGPKLLRYSTLLCGMLPAFVACSQPEPVSVPDDAGTGASPALRVEKGLLVAHALGSVAGLTYTNSIEALDCNYARGHRWFEVDLALTSDDEILCFHEGHERQLGLLPRVQELTARDVAGRKYGGLYPLRSFRELLDRADELGDVVFVLDTKDWSERMRNALRKVVHPRSKTRRSTRLVLHSYGRDDIAAVTQLSKEINAEVILALYLTDSADEEVEQLAKEHDVLAVAADMYRFSPWLADRLQRSNIPILVHTVNDHRDVMRLTEAGADGLYTDYYKPYNPAKAGEPSTDCALAPSNGRDAAVWLERAMFRTGDYKLAQCVARRNDVLELSSCEPGIVLRSHPMSIPPQREVLFELDIEAANDPSSAWIELAGQNGRVLLQPRAELHFNGKERRVIKLRVQLDSGTSGFEARLGTSTSAAHFIIHRLAVHHDPSATSPDETPAQPTDAG